MFFTLDRRGVRLICKLSSHIEHILNHVNHSIVCFSLLWLGKVCNLYDPWEGQCAKILFMT